MPRLKNSILGEGGGDSNSCNILINVIDLIYTDNDQWFFFVVHSAIKITIIPTKMRPVFVRRITRKCWLPSN